MGRGFELRGPRVSMRQLQPDHFEMWRDVRVSSGEWLTKWEPRPLSGTPDVVSDKRAFASRCGIRDREWQLGAGYGLGLFVGERFAGEINISNVQRGPFMNAHVGYWIGEEFAGHGYIPDGLVLVFKFAFEELGLHRLQISIIPRNKASRRVAEKLDLRDEGVALRYLEINGVWEDHVRYAITSEDWYDKHDFYVSGWLES
jgi:[ribosomal protein S5]-alanine N-acetyltransferase